MATTLLLRRRQRREKVDAVASAAAEGLKDAGRKGLAIGAAGAEAAGRGAAALAGAAAQGVAKGAHAGAATIGTVLAALHQRIARLSAPLTERLARPAWSRTLAALAILLAAASAVRAGQFGLDRDAALTGALALLAALAWIWPRIFVDRPPADQTSPAADTDDAEPTHLTARLTRRVLDTPATAASLLPLASAAVFAALMLWLAAPVVLSWISPDATPPARPPAPVSAPASAEAPAEPSGGLTGRASVTASGALRIGPATLNLDGITLLDKDQTCRRANGTSWSCGEAAHAALAKLARGQRNLSCTLTGEVDGVSVGTCLAAGRDLGAELVRSGHAFASGTLWKTYASEEAEAQTAAAGLWAGEPERPGEWRARLWEEASANSPGGCPIKARINGSRKTYSLPGDRDYARTVLRESRGDRWFCSEEEASTSGFTPRRRD